MRCWTTLLRILGFGLRPRVRDLEQRMAKVEGAQEAFRQFAQDARR